jgi:hypothetical protein
MIDPYNLADIEELVQFDKDCASAIAECPQEQYIDNEVSIRRKEISPMQVYDNYTNEDNVLWDKDYYSELTPRALATFEYVREYGMQGLRYLCGVEHMKRTQLPLHFGEY